MLDIINAAENVIQTEIYASNGDLGDVLTIYKGGGIAPRPIPKFPLIIIGADNEERQHRRAAGTAEVGFGEHYRWFIAISHSTGNLFDSFEKVCNIWEELKPIIDDNYTWQTNVHDTNYDGAIEYGAVNPFTGIDESQLTYTILVRLISNVRWGG